MGFTLHARSRAVEGLIAAYNKTEDASLKARYLLHLHACIKKKHLMMVRTGGAQGPMIMVHIIKRKHGHHQIPSKI